MHTARTAKILTITMVLALNAALVSAQTSDEDQVKKVATSESDAFFNCDGEAWAATWLHDGKATRTLVANDRYLTTKGWDSFGPGMIADLKRRKPDPVKLSYDDYIVRINGNLAWVEYDQHIEKVGQNTNTAMVSREYSLLSKENDGWKIATQIHLNTASFSTAPQTIETTLNDIAYKLLDQKKTKEAIVLLKLNTQLYPDSANTYDSLGEAQALDGDKAEAIKNYEKAIALDPKRDTSKAALAKLKQ